MLNPIQNFLLAVIEIFLFFWFFSSVSGCKELSEKYKTENPLPNTFFMIQSGAFMNQTSIKGLNIGVSGEGLFLSVPPPINIAYPSLLIPWDEISYGQAIDNNSRAGYFIFELGKPKIASLQLSSNTIKKIHEGYGIPIFFERLGEPN